MMLIVVLGCCLDLWSISVFVLCCYYPLCWYFIMIDAPPFAGCCWFIFLGIQDVSLLLGYCDNLLCAITVKAWYPCLVSVWCRVRFH